MHAWIVHGVNLRRPELARHPGRRCRRLRDGCCRLPVYCADVGREPLGFQFGVVRRRRDAPIPAARGRRLLHRVHKLVREQVAARLGVRAVLMAAHHYVVAYGVRASVNFARGLRGCGVRMDPHLAQAMAKSCLH